MTAIAFLISGVVAALWFEVVGRTVVGPLTVWLAWWLIPFGIGGWYVWNQGSWRSKIGWAFLLIFFATGQFLWSNGASALSRAWLHAAMALAFAGIGSRSSHIQVSYLFILAVGIDFMAYCNAFPPRPKVFIAWAYPDLLAGVSHAATIILCSPFDGGTLWWGKGRRRIVRLGRGIPALRMLFGDRMGQME